MRVNMQRRIILFRTNLVDETALRGVDGIDQLLKLARVPRRMRTRDVASITMKTGAGID